MINKAFKFLLHPALLLLIIGILVATSVYSYVQYNDARSQLKKVNVELEELRNSPQATASEIKILVDKVGRIVALPTDETPTVATVTDIEKLREQPFFANAQNGDKILIYRNARKAYLYRPDDNKIIEVAPINITQQQAAEGENTDSSSEQGNPESTTTPVPSLTSTPTTQPSSSPVESN